MKNLSKVTVSFLFVPRKKAWERRCARPQAPKRWPGRLFAIKLRINDGFGMFFRCILTTRLHCTHLLSRFLFEAPMGATRHEPQTFHSRMHEKDGASGVFTSFAQKNMFSTPTANCSNVVDKLLWLYRKGTLGSTYPVLSAIVPCAFLGAQGNLVPTVHSNDGPWV